VSTSPLVLSDAVREALADGRPVVALESTIISHGFPRPRNLEVARRFEQVLVDAGVTPATIAVVDGVPRVGLDEEGLTRIAEDTAVVKVSSRDLGAAMVQGVTGATTVAATALLASRAGIRVFSTGGLGGVHRGAAESFDESADLAALSRLPITVVSAGVKSILDIRATLERLETLGVTVLGYRTSRYPAFYVTDSGVDIDWRVESAEDVAAVMAAQDALGLGHAVLVANPLPADRQLDPELHDRVLADALAAAQRNGVTGKAVTPFLLDHFQRHTQGASLEVNTDIAVSNIALGGEIATAWARRGAASGQPAR
jgi:pseudouridylate synthase